MPCDDVSAACDGEGVVCVDDGGGVGVVAFSVDGVYYCGSVVEDDGVEGLVYVCGFYVGALFCPVLLCSVVGYSLS